MLSKFLGRLSSSRLEISENSLRPKRDSWEEGENIPATTDPDLFQKRVAELRLALAAPETEKA